MNVDGTGVRQLPQGKYDDFDARYLPDGRIIFDSTRVFQGIPCVTGSDRVANLFVMDADGLLQKQLSKKPKLSRFYCP